MLTIKKYFYLFVLALVVGLGVYGYLTTVALQQTKVERDRWETNFVSVQDKIKVLSLKIDDVKKVQGLKIDSILKEVKVKPKNVTQYIEAKTIYNYGDTTITVVEPVVKDSNTYTFADTMGCVKVNGLVKLTDTVPQVFITNKRYESNAYYVFHNERQPYKFLFWTWKLFGKREKVLDIITDCGKTTAINLDIIK